MTQSNRSDETRRPSGTYQLTPLEVYETNSGALDLGSLVSVVWQGRLVVGAFALACALGASILSFILPASYRSDALLQPVIDGSARSLNQVTNQIGFLAQVGLSSLSATGDTAAALATLESRTLLETFIKENDLLPLLFPDKWDAVDKKWNVSDPGEIPGLRDGYDVFRKRLVVSEQKKSGLVRLQLDSRDPVLAEAWLNGLIARANRLMRDRAIQESEAHLRFLNVELGKTTVAELRSSLFSLIESEMKRVMIAKGNDQYAFKVIDPAVVPTKRHGPRRGRWLATGLMIGFLLGVGLVLTRDRIQLQR